MTSQRMTVSDIRARKKSTPIVCLTAYTAPMAELLDPHADILLVGDSVGMVLYGMESTLTVTREMICAHGKAVVKASRQACVVVDMPFGTYQASPEAAFENAAAILQETGCTAVKLEGGQVMAETVAFLVERGIPVMGHVGLLPQSVHALGGYRYQGRSAAEQKAIVKDAVALEKAGAFSMVIEAVAEPVARKVTQAVDIPTIGIGASAACDGQVLVSEDLLGLTPHTPPSFVKRYATLHEEISASAERYAEDVKKRKFPGPEQCFTQ